LDEFIACSMGLQISFVFVPKYLEKKLYGKFRSRVGEILRDLCRQRGVELLEGHLKPDHIHMCLRVAPKYSIAFVIGFLKGEVKIYSGGKTIETLVSGGFFGTELILLKASLLLEARAIKTSEIYSIQGEFLKDIPIIRWKLLATYKKRIRAALTTF